MASIRTRQRKDGSEYYTITWREDGLQRAHSFDTMREAETWKRLLDANGQSMTKAVDVYEASEHEGPTVAEAMVDHIDQLVGTTPYTIKRYRSAVRLHFSGPLGRMKIKAVTHGHIIEWIKWMQDRDKGAKTIALQHGLLSATMETAERKGIIEKNPCRGVRLPKKARVGADGDDIDLDDFRAIRDRTEPHFQPFLDFLVGTGCRFSEATPLLASDFALEASPPMVFITKAHKLGGDEDPARYVGEPKSRKSRRRVSLAPSTVESIRPLVEQAGLDGGPVFRMKEGGVFTSQSFYNHSWERARREAGLGIGSAKHVTVHSIRHLHAAIMLHAGMSLYELSTRLGHTSIQITADLYASLVPDAHFRGAQHAAKALGGVSFGDTGLELDEVG
jgi:integrase